MYIYFHLKMVLRPKHVVDNLNKIVKNYWNRVALDGNPSMWSNTTGCKHPSLRSSIILHMTLHFIGPLKWLLSLSFSLSEQDTTNLSGCSYEKVCKVFQNIGRFNLIWKITARGLWVCSLCKENTVCCFREWYIFTTVTLCPMATSVPANVLWIHAGSFRSRTSASMNLKVGNINLIRF
jgi:hypothetical protein